MRILGAQTLRCTSGRCCARCSRGCVVEGADSGAPAFRIVHLITEAGLPWVRTGVLLLRKVQQECVCVVLGPELQLH